MKCWKVCSNTNIKTSQMSIKTKGVCRALGEMHMCKDMLYRVKSICENKNIEYL